MNKKRRPYYTVCPNCGANLDPGEKCDCVKPWERSLILSVNKKRTKTDAWKVKTA